MDLQTRIRLYEHAPGVPLRTAIDKCEPLHHQARPFGNDNLSADGPEPWQSMTTASPGAASSLAFTGSVTLQPRASAGCEFAEYRMAQLATTLSQAPCCPPRHEIRNYESRPPKFGITNSWWPTSGTCESIVCFSLWGQMKNGATRKRFRTTK